MKFLYIITQSSSETFLCCLWLILEKGQSNNMSYKEIWTNIDLNRIFSINIF